MEISEQSARQNLGIEPAPHLHCAVSTARIMTYVLLSLVPALGVMTFFFGSGVLCQLALTAITALVCQLVTNFLRGRPLKRALKDPSGLVTATLLAMTLPPLTPWYFTVVTTTFAILLVRECFGGLGMNLFNPAMSGFVFLVIAAPSIFFNTWIAPTPYAITVATPERVMDVVLYRAAPEPLLADLKALNQQQNKAWEQEILAQGLSLTQANAHSTAASQDSASTTSSTSATSTAANASSSTITSDSATPANAVSLTTPANSVAPVANDITPADALTLAEDLTAHARATAGDNAATADASTAAMETSRDLAYAQPTSDTASDSAAIGDNATIGDNAAIGNNAAIGDSGAGTSRDVTTPKAAAFDPLSNSTIKIKGQVDILTGATFLDSIKTSHKAGDIRTIGELDYLSPSFIAYLWLAGAYVLGGLFLIFTHTIRYQIPLFFLIAVITTGGLWHYLAPAQSVTILEHLLMGGTLLGAFYIITDPVTSCGTARGRIYFALIVGFLVVTLRIHSSYADAVAFAVMLGNCIAPLMDVLTRRRPFGVGYRKGGLK